MLSAFAHPRMSTGSQKQLRGHSFAHSSKVIVGSGDIGDIGDGFGESGDDDKKYGDGDGATKEGGGVVCLN